MDWKPWNEAQEDPNAINHISGPPCPYCDYWKPSINYSRLEGKEVVDDVQFCHAPDHEMFFDFSCFKPLTPEKAASPAVGRWRTAEIWRQDWTSVAFADIKRGDLFRMFEPDGAPAYKGAIWQAASDAEPIEGSSGHYAVLVNDCDVLANAAGRGQAC